MSDTTALVPSTGPIDITATNPVEMQQSQSLLIKWCEEKIASVRQDAEELAESFAVAVKRKWKSATLKRHADLARKRVTFYEKLKAAFEAGYCIVPNFPVDVFAIRTSRRKPFKKVFVGTYKASGWHFKQPPELLPVGEGEYQSPDPLVTTYTDTKTDASGAVKKSYHEAATHFDDVEFPMQMAKPKIMEVTGRAMLKKIFDQFGLFAQGTGDPIITGELLYPDRAWTKHTPALKRVTFIIAWHVNIRDL